MGTQPTAPKFQDLTLTLSAADAQQLQVFAAERGLSLPQAAADCIRAQLDTGTANPLFQDDLVDTVGHCNLVLSALSCLLHGRADMDLNEHDRSGLALILDTVRTTLKAGVRAELPQEAAVAPSIAEPYLNAEGRPGQ